MFDAGELLDYWQESPCGCCLISNGSIPSVLLLAKSVYCGGHAVVALALMASNHPLATGNLLATCFLGQACPLGTDDMLCGNAGVPTLVLVFIFFLPFCIYHLLLLPSSVHNIAIHPPTVYHLMSRRNNPGCRAKINLVA